MTSQRKTKSSEAGQKKKSSPKMPAEQVGYSKNLATKLAKKKKEYQQQLEEEALELITQFEHKSIKETM